MENIQLMHANGDPIAIEEGCPPGSKFQKIADGNYYHAKVGPRDYILFQNKRIGPYDIWLTDYSFGRETIIRCAMETSGVEYHNLLEGSGVYSLNKGLVWRKEEPGEQNFMVNARLNSTTVFIDLPVRTLDIHIDADYFEDLAARCPVLQPLLVPLASFEPSTLYADMHKSSLKQKQLQALIVNQLMRPAGGPKDQEAKTFAIFELVEESIFLVDAALPVKPVEYDFTQAEVQKLISIKEFIMENLIEPTVLSDADKHYKIDKSKFAEGFSCLYKYKPKKFIIEEKMKRVLSFIEAEPSAKYREVAAVVGYNDVGHFSKVFKGRFGKTLTEYRKDKKKKGDQ